MVHVPITGSLVSPSVHFLLVSLPAQDIFIFYIHS